MDAPPFRAILSFSRRAHWLSCCAHGGFFVRLERSAHVHPDGNTWGCDEHHAAVNRKHPMQAVKSLKEKSPHRTQQRGDMRGERGISYQLMR